MIQNLWGVVEKNTIKSNVKAREYGSIVPLLLILFSYRKQFYSRDKRGLSMWRTISLYHGNSRLPLYSSGKWNGRLSDVAMDRSYSNSDCRLSWYEA